jgi:hypothetical protein
MHGRVAVIVEERVRALRSAGAIVLRAALGALICIVLCACQIEGLRPGAKSVLEVFQGPTPEEAAKMAIDEYDANARYEGTRLLSTASFAGEPVYMDLFAQRTRDADAGVRAVACRAIGTHGRPEHAPLLVERLKDESVVVRVEAARALQRIHDAQAIPALVERLDPMKEDEVGVRVEAATALGQYRQGRVVEALIGALSDDNLAVNARARDALRTLTGQDLGVDRKAWQSWYAGTQDLFAAGSGYTFPAYQRSKHWYEYFPFVRQPALETPGVPAGLSP